MEHGDDKSSRRRLQLYVAAFYVLRSVGVVSFFLGLAAAMLDYEWPFRTWSAWTKIILLLVLPFTAISICRVLAKRINRD
jgi:hypothetical protein